MQPARMGLQRYRESTCAVEKSMLLARKCPPTDAGHRTSENGLIGGCIAARGEVQSYTSICTRSEGVSVGRAMNCGGVLSNAG